MNARNPTHSLDIYFVGLWCLIMVVCAGNLPYIISSSITDTIYNLLLIASYSFMYLLPSLCIGWLLRHNRRWRLPLVLILSAITVSFLFVDGRLFGLYGFHFNGFVWNLLTTPGGYASMGADQVSQFTLLKYVLQLIAGLGICLFLNRLFANGYLRGMWIVTAFLGITLSERIIYSIAYSELYGPIMTQADHMLLYQPLTMNSFLESIGHNVKLQDESASLDSSAPGQVNYPLHELSVDPVSQPYNIVFLVAESLRYPDIYNERVMPNTHAFARDHGTTFTQHVSGGNGTRQALFAMFYGLYGTYWDAFLRARRSPAVFDVLNQYEYQYFLYTSSYFTYPEFDKTIFGSVPASSLVETSDGEAWTRDDRNVEKMLAKISQRDLSRPFMSFIFFEGTHARYSFPERTAIEPNYARKLDYAELKASEMQPLMDGMFARYKNAVHAVDMQFERVFEYLEKNKLLENTIVVVTGDHGEEFMEKERWGHNSSFVDEQIRIPLIISHPDYGPREVNTMTSHLDIPAMLMTALGVKNPIDDYSLGTNIMETPVETMAIVASWADLGIVSERGKLVIPFRSTTQHRHLATTRDDVPMDLGELTRQLQPEIATVIANSRKFIQSE